MRDPSVDPAHRSGTAVVRILGDVRVVAGARVIDLPSASQRRLLALLALDPGTALRRDRLCDLLGITPGALRTTISRLRARLGSALIRTEVSGYRMSAAVDATIFVERVLGRSIARDRLDVLDDALALWHGQVLDEFRHEHWAESEVARLDEIRSLAVEERAELLTDRGRAAEAVVCLEVHIAANPFRDRPRGLLIKALAAEGRQADALRSFQDYRALLIRETGTEPSAEVRSLEQRVAAGAAERRAHGDARVVGIPGDRGSRSPDRDAPVSIPLPAALVRTAPLVGRRPQWDEIAGELHRAQTGSLRSVLVGGEPGIGKTTLLAAFARAQHAECRACVLYARCHQGATAPLQPLREAIGPAVEHAPVPLLRAHGERCGGALLRIAPQLAQRVWLPPPLDADGTDSRRLLAEAMSDLLHRLAERVPVILVLDDLHWAEPTTLDLLRLMADHLAEAPLLLVGSYRQPGAGPSTELRHTLAELDRSGARRLALEGLERDELADLAESVVGPTAAVGGELLGRLRHETAGNPLFATHLLRHWADTGVPSSSGGGLGTAVGRDGLAVPPGLRDLVWSRVRSVGADCHEVLQVASVLGESFDEEVLTEIADLGSAEVYAALDSALDAGLVHDSGDDSTTMRFTHALVARTLYEELRGARRRALRRRAAAVLDRAGRGS